MFSSVQLQTLVNHYIESLSYARPPMQLYEPIKYMLQGGGKRIRPCLLLMAYNLYNDDVEPAMQLAAAIELYHNHTLLHDDVMDKSDIRHGRPTVHKVWNENAAILSGDTMLVLAYRYASAVRPDKLGRVYQIFSQTAIEIAEGQQYDIEFETRDNVTEAEYIEMIRLKTSVLLAASLTLGGVAAGAPEEDLLALYRLGESVGIAFQLQDDLLDVYGDVETFGKKIGNDILCNKKTYLLIDALNRADAPQQARLQQWLQGTHAPQEKIEGVRAIYDALQVKEKCEAAIDRYFSQGLAHLEALSLPQERKEELARFVNSLMKRKK